MKKSVLNLGFLALVSMPFAAKADLILGVLNTTGAADISFGSVSFQDGGPDSGLLSITGSQTGGFNAFIGTTVGTVDDITNPPDATTIPLDVPDFITFSGPESNISITLTELLPGIDGAAGCSDAIAAAGQVCTPDVPVESPFNLQNTSATSSTASFNILGIEVDSLTGDTIGITGAFTTPFDSMTFQELLATVGDAPGGGIVATPFSAQFTTGAVAPEPGTLIALMIGMAALGANLIRRKKFQKG
jgi:hypothetical protein